MPLVLDDKDWEGGWHNVHKTSIQQYVSSEIQVKILKLVYALLIAIDLEKETKLWWLSFKDEAQRKQSPSFAAKLAQEEEEERQKLLEIEAQSKHQHELWEWHEEMYKQRLAEKEALAEKERQQRLEIEVNTDILIFDNVHLECIFKKFKFILQSFPVPDQKIFS